MIYWLTLRAKGSSDSSEAKGHNYSFFRLVHYFIWLQSIITSLGRGATIESTCVCSRCRKKETEEGGGPNHQMEKKKRNA